MLIHNHLPGRVGIAQSRNPCMLMRMKLWNPGDTAAIRGMINGKLWLAQSVKVVQDTPSETVLLLAPGAECAYPSGYWRWKRHDFSQGTRWDDALSMAWTLRRFAWHTKRLLILMEPEKIYATYIMWDDATDAFLGYYINFQTPFERSPAGFDTLDLELDIEIDPQFTWAWKDAQLYSEGIRLGCIAQTDADSIECAKPGIFEMIANRTYPLDGSWVNWRPDPAWEPTKFKT